MARHRNIRNLDLDIDDHPDDFGKSVEECLSPTQAQFMYRPQAHGATLTDYFAESDELTAERTQSPYQQIQSSAGYVQQTNEQPAPHYNQHDDEDYYDDDDGMFGFDDVVGGKGHAHSGARKGKKNNKGPSATPAASTSSKKPTPKNKPSNSSTPSSSTAQSSFKSPKIVQANTSSVSTPFSRLSLDENSFLSTPDNPTFNRVLSEDPSRLSRSNTPTFGSARRTPAQSPMPRRPKNRERASEAQAHINLVVVGHVDAGKSTLMGHLLHAIGVVTKQQMHTYRRDADRIGKASFAYAWVLDDTQDERSRGITMDIAVRHFTTSHRQVTLLDAPGHKDFIPNMITGASMADNAILVINATTGEFESGFDAGGQTREHAQLVRSLGVTKVVCAVNKLDTVDWSVDRYNHICETLRTFLCKTVGFADAAVTFVPVSGLSGVNLVDKPPADHPMAAWYEGPTLLELIDCMPPAPILDTQPLRLSISSVYRAASGATTVCGRVLQGTIDVGDVVVVEPQHVTATVKQLASDTRETGGQRQTSIDEETFDAMHSPLTSSMELSTVYSGDACTMVLTGAQLEGVTLTTGSIVCHPDHDPIRPVNKLTVKLVVFAPDIPLLAGQPVELHAHNVSEAATISKLVSMIDKKTGKQLPKRPRCLPAHSSGVIILSSQSCICLSSTTDSSCKPLCRVTIRSKGHTIAAGVVTEAGIA